ncbi:MAG: hypothetical protein EOS78_05685 [Mesorhizobium sp.]|uniref:hypothetical protein n=1 Tax=unclassified Mesorhizobium TaxID=325217 RepID=UPI000F74D1E4|nr:MULTISPECIES: hypothetical protein [unclassified Mesorhizobium]AZO52893.1 hypothetical protein EJ077_04790 [Mesorhizobium sp. M8A.F.Ca.ET.057.01.1.1]RWE42175.1 MAG: hypothetical protein EOS78_05685 [Mesorhizobium sp.]RWE42593.1 MAG: hypothetical protein EOS80_25365 [Mesorhizobium sp.]
MTLAATMPAVGAAMATGPAIARSAAHGLTPRALLRRGQNHSPKDKGNCADEKQQQDSKVHPSGSGHLKLSRFQHPLSQIPSTKRM